MSESFQSASLSSLWIVSSSIPYMIRLQIIFDFLSDSLFLRRLFFVSFEMCLRIFSLLNPRVSMRMNSNVIFFCLCAIRT